MKPACMTHDEYERWEFWNRRIVVLVDMADSPCQDCPASFAQRMRAIDRCDGEPGYVKAERIRPYPQSARDRQSEAAKLAARGRHEEAVGRASMALRLFEQGMTRKQIAERMGLSRSAIHMYLSRRRGAAA